MSMASVKSIEWYNEVVKPLEIGTGKRHNSIVSDTLDSLFLKLPVDLSSLFQYLTNSPELFLKGNLIDRLFITLFNEEDDRIASLDTKLQVLIICQRICEWQRIGRIRIRRGIQAVQIWADEIEIEEGLSLAWVRYFLFKKF
jgi:hypothetical protein